MGFASLRRSCCEFLNATALCCALLRRVRLRFDGHFIQVVLEPQPGWMHLGATAWLEDNAEYVYHITIGWTYNLSWTDYDAFLQELAALEKEVAREAVVLTGRFSSLGSLCFLPDQNSLDALGPLFAKWSAKADTRNMPHCSM